MQNVTGTALDMAALSARCSALSMVYNLDILHSLCARACTYCGSMYLVCLILSASHTVCEPY